MGVNPSQQGGTIKGTIAAATLNRFLDSWLSYRGKHQRAIYQQLHSTGSDPRVYMEGCNHLAQLKFEVAEEAVVHHDGRVN